MLEGALAICYRALVRRDYGLDELRWRLERAEFDDVTIEQALAVLREEGMVDDTHHDGHGYIGDRSAFENWGQERIREHLEAAGVDRDLIDAAVELRTADAELNEAVELLRARGTDAPSDNRARGRAVRFLTRRGYDADLAYEAVRRVSRDSSAV